MESEKQLKCTRSILLRTQEVDAIAQVFKQFGIITRPELFTKSGAFTAMLNSIGTPQCTSCLNQLTCMCGHFHFKETASSVEISDGKNKLIIAHNADDWILIISEFSCTCAYTAIGALRNNESCTLFFPMQARAKPT